MVFEIPNQSGILRVTEQKRSKQRRCYIKADKCTKAIHAPKVSSMVDYRAISQGSASSRQHGSGSIDLPVLRVKFLCLLRPSLASVRRLMLL